MATLDWSQCPAVESVPDRVGGAWVFRGTRLPVATVIENLEDLSVEEVMTRGPRTVRPDQLASEALEILNTSKKTQLIVVERGKPVGIVHIHDLLRAGVA